MISFCIGVNTSDASLICLFGSCFYAFLSDRYTVRNIMSTDGANASWHNHLWNTLIDTNLSQRCWYQLLGTVYNRTMYTMGHPHCPFPAWYCRTLGYTQAFQAKAWFAYSAMARLGCLRTKRELNIYPLFKKGMYLTSLVYKMTSFSSKDQWWSHSQV